MHPKAGRGRIHDAACRLRMFRPTKDRHTRPMLNEFLHWWAQQLRDAWPGRKAGGGTMRRGLVAALQGSSLAMAVRRNGRSGALGQFGMDPAGVAALRAATAGQGPGVALLLTADALLEQEAVLPIAAERDMLRVLHYEMDRLTPFAASDVVWTGTVARRDRVHGRLHVRLSLVPRARIAPAMDALRAAGLRPEAIEVAVPGGARYLPLDGHATRSGGAAWAGGACAALAVICAALPFVAQSVASNRVEARIAALRPAVDQVDALRRRMQASAGGTGVIADQRGRVGDALGTLAILTDVLPDDTYLNELTLRARMLTMAGQSAGAARLIAALAADPGLRNPAFAAPVTRGEGTRVEGFSIRAEMAP